MTPMQSRLLQNVFFTADPGEPTEHWLWLGRKNNCGYGTVNVYRNGMSRPEYAHRESYRQFVGPIPDGYEIDHKATCLTPCCIRPDCLQAVPMPENRGLAWKRTLHRRAQRQANGRFKNGQGSDIPESSGQDR